MNKWLLSIKIIDRLHGVIDFDSLEELKEYLTQHLTITIETNTGQVVTKNPSIVLEELFPELVTEEK